MAANGDGTQAADASFTHNQKLILLACILGSSAAFLDGTIVNVALPAIRASLHGGLGTQEWVVDAYLLTLGSLLLVGGSLGDVFGRARVFEIGVIGFGIASVICALAPDAGALIAARAVQGIASAMLVPSTLALIMDTFSENQRAAAIGAWTAWTGIATVAGPLLGGLLIQLGSWRWVFIVNVPLVLVTVWLIRRVPTRAAPAGGRVDWVGGLLGASGLAGPIYALIEQPTYGWGDPRVLITLIAGCVLLIAFALWERQSAAPMLPAALFRVGNFRVGNLATFAFYGALNVMTFFLVVYLQQVGGYTPLAAGLSLLPLSIITFFLAKRFGALADRYGPRLFMGIGPLVAGAGLLLLLRLGVHPRYITDVFPAAILLGLGLGITVAPLTAAVLASVPPEHSGVASGINNAVARVAGLVAIAVVGAVVATHYSSQVQQGIAQPRATPTYRTAVKHAASATFEIVPPQALPSAQVPHARHVLEDASTSTIHLAMLIAALLSILSGVLSLVGIRNPREIAAKATPGGAICGASGALRSGSQ
jgi:EmrB/QacA subfamily drug resistance transporter